MEKKYNKILTYEDVLKALNKKSLGYFITYISNKNKLLAISELMTIANYYNGDWKPDWNNASEYKYHIMHNSNDDTYAVDYNGRYTLNNIYFKNREDAISVINNPNFKDILNTIYKN